MDGWILCSISFQLLLYILISICLYILTLNTGEKMLIFTLLLLHLLLHNSLLLHMNIFFFKLPVLPCFGNSSLFNLVWHLVKQNTQYSMCHLEQLLRPCQLWLASFHDHQSELHPSTPITVKQQEDQLYGGLIGTEEKRSGGKKPLTSLSISPPFLTASACSITPSYGKRQRSKTERWEKDRAI